MRLAAIHVERELLKERVGVQDQLHAAFGGINRFDFVDGRIRVTPVQMRSDCQQHLMSSLVLVYTGITRYASADPARSRSRLLRSARSTASSAHLLALTKEAVNVLEGDDPEHSGEDSAP